MSAIITIKKPVDITVARTFLRKRIAGAEWTPTCRARAVAVLTIFAELILSLQATGAIHVSILTWHDPMGIELKSTVNASGDHAAYVEEMGNRLKRVTDESEISVQDQVVTVGARIWTTRKVVLHG